VKSPVRVPQHTIAGAPTGKSKAHSGSDTDSTYPCSDTDSEPVASTAKKNRVKQPAENWMDSALATAQSKRDAEKARHEAEEKVRCRMKASDEEGANELDHLSALLVSKRISPHAKQRLTEYSMQPDGRLACVLLLRTELMGDNMPPRRSLVPESFATVQDLLGRLTLGAMQREATDELEMLVAVSHAITKAPLDECEECEMECQECDPDGGGGDDEVPRSHGVADQGFVRVD